MCSVIILRRPDAAYPLLFAGNRDEMAGRPARPPGRHWPDRPDVVAGFDALAGGSWLGVNDTGVVASVLNREGTLGPLAGKRSRGELVLDALDYADAVEAAAALAAIDGSAYRPFNLVIADNRDAFWLRNRGDGGGKVECYPLPPGLSMITAADRNDLASPRIGQFLPRFEAAPAPEPGADPADLRPWRVWIDLLGSRQRAPEDTEGRSALCVVTGTGFGTVSSALIALPAMARPDLPPHFLFAAGRPDEAPFQPVELGWADVGEFAAE